MSLKKVDGPPPVASPSIREYDEVLRELQQNPHQCFQILEDVDRPTAERWRRALDGRGAAVARRGAGDEGGYSLYAEYPKPAGRRRGQ